MVDHREESRCRFSVGWSIVIADKDADETSDRCFGEREFFSTSVS